MSTFAELFGPKPEPDGAAPHETVYLCLMTVTRGYRKGWNRLYSLPWNFPIEDLDAMLVQLFLPSGGDWDITSVKLLSSVMVHGLECRSWAEILPVYYNSEVTVGSLDVLSGAAELHIVIDVNITRGGIVTNMATWDLTFTVQTAAAGQGGLACLSGVNMDDENGNPSIFSKADEIALLKMVLG
ncbi:hypothetical protein MMC27_001501 [Xylographa pallens]|nr:hypothetical protein [Xylographa pallens]